jgi:hypothetical protein
MQNFTQQKYFFYIAFMLMASAYFPLLFNNLPPLVRSHHVWTALWGISLLLAKPKIFFSKPMLYILGYGFLVLLATQIFWPNIDGWNSKMLFVEFYNIAIGASVINYFLQSKDYISLAKVTRWSIVFLFITAVMTIISSAIDPLYARNIVNIVALSDQSGEILKFKRYGGGGQATAAAFMCLFPILIFYFKNIKLSPISKKLIIVYSVIIFLALLGMQIFANILIATAFFFIAILGRKKIQQTVMIISFFLFLTIFIPQEIYVNGLYSISGVFPQEGILSNKFKDLAIFIETGSDIEDKSTGAGSRGNRYKQLAENFIKAPLLGCFFNSDHTANGYFNYYYDYGNDIGQVEGTHLHWMNKLTITGIIGLLIFLFIPYKHIKNNLRYFDSEYKFYYIVASISILSYGFLKTIAGREIWYAFFIILPGLYYLPLLKKEDNKI